MKTDHLIEERWQRDVPPASDMTFVLAVLQRIERRRLWRSMAGVFSGGMLATLLLWQFMPLLALWVTPLQIALWPMMPLEWLLIFLVVAVVIELERRIPG